MSGKTMEEIRSVLVVKSWKSNGGKGARVCYPNEVLAELFGKEVLDDHYIPEKD